MKLTKVKLKKLNRHKELGKRIKTYITSNLMTKDATVKEAMKLFDSIRNELDDEVGHMFPELGNDELNAIYYGRLHYEIN